MFNEGILGHFVSTDEDTFAISVFWYIPSLKNIPKLVEFLKRRTVVVGLNVSSKIPGKDMFILFKFLMHLNPYIFTDVLLI